MLGAREERCAIVAGAGDLKDGDVVLLAKRLSGVGEESGACVALEQFANAIEAEDRSVLILSFDHAVSDEEKLICRCHGPGGESWFRAA